jgi:hypothetical protein
VGGQCAGDLQTSEKMTDTQDVLTVLDDFHFGVNF